jgi:uncharacterized protein with ParB-like and HNH nuclease domain
MSIENKINSKIDADDKSLLEILNQQKFTIDYFQREYLWERKQIEQLMNDLETAFNNNYNPNHKRKEVENYNCYYMGPLVMSSKDGKLSIIDGQQRLTSITLLLIYLNHLQKNHQVKESVDGMIFSEKHGEKSYNMQIPEREKCFDGLYLKGEYEISDKDDESVQNLVERYEDFQELFPEELKNESLPYFISWLKEKLIFVKIVSYSEENAYTIFETMNDRGLNLTPTDMLKGYLLSKIKDIEIKNALNSIWKENIGELKSFWEDELEDQTFFKAWLRAKYAVTIRPGRKGASNEDFEKLGTSFHTWVKDNHNLIGLNDDEDFIEIIREKLVFYSKIYQKILAGSETFNPVLSYVYFTSYYPIADSLTFPLFLSPITEEDNDSIQNKKLQLVAFFLDCFAVYRSINQRTLGQSSLRYTLYSLVKEIRNKTVTDLADILKQKMDEFSKENNLSGIYDFTLNQQNKRFVRYFLARLTYFIENESGINSSIDNYMADSVKKPAQVEHIWADVYDYVKDEFDQKTDFQWYRNTLGDLILLPKGTNQSFNKDPYSKKLPHYLKQNLLAQSLHPECYVKNPNFTKWYKQADLDFQPHTQFKKGDLEERTSLYEEIAERIWNSEIFDEIANS